MESTLRIVQPNRITQMNYKNEVSNAEMNIVHYIVTQLQSNMTRDSSAITLKTFEIEVPIEAAYKGKNGDRIVKRTEKNGMEIETSLMHAAVENLFNNSVSSVSYDCENEETTFQDERIIIKKSFTVDKKNRVISAKLTVNPSMLPALLDLSEGFTKLDSDIYTSIESPVAKRLYENICRCKRFGYLKISLVELYQLCNFKSTITTGKIKVFVNRAVNHIIKCSGDVIEFLPVKRNKNGENDYVEFSSSKESLQASTTKAKFDYITIRFKFLNINSDDEKALNQYICELKESFIDDLKLRKDVAGDLIRNFQEGNPSNNQTPVDIEDLHRKYFRIRNKTYTQDKNFETFIHFRNTVIKMFKDDYGREVNKKDYFSK